MFSRCCFQGFSRIDSTDLEHFAGLSFSNDPMFKARVFQKTNRGNYFEIFLLHFKQFGGSRVKNNGFRGPLACPLTLEIMKMETSDFGESGYWNLPLNSE